MFNQFIVELVVEFVVQWCIVFVIGVGCCVGCVIVLVLVWYGWDVVVYCYCLCVEVDVVVVEIVVIGCCVVVLQVDLLDEVVVGCLIVDCIVVLGMFICLVNNVLLFQYDVVISFSYVLFDMYMCINVVVLLLLLCELYWVLIVDGVQGYGVVINLFDQKFDNLNLDFFLYMLLKVVLLMVMMQLV